MCALAQDGGAEYDPGLPPAPELLETLSLLEHAGPVIGEDGSYEKARQRRRERRKEAAIPAWLAAEDLIAQPWEPAQSRFV
jgi:hypothetical protein